MRDKHTLVRSDMRASSGFTLIEVMVVVVIIGVLATLVMPQVIGQTDKAFKAKARADIRALSSAFDLYKLDNYRYPSTAEGLKALMGEGGAESNRANRKYLRKLPRDPWGNPYNYLAPGRNGAYDIWSWGADGQPGGDREDADIGNWMEASS